MEILGVKIDVTNLATATERITEWIQAGHKSYVCVAPVATIMDCQRDSVYRNIINNADMVTPDGMPVVWLGKWRGQHTIGRTYGPDLMLAACSLSEQKGFRHYFYGGSEETCNLLVHRLQQQFPSLQIVGKYSPPVRDMHGQETPEIVNQINKAKPDILWVGLGSPKQDYWMSYHRRQLEAPVIIGVGAAFDFLAGTKIQAPGWIQRSGLEWFFRLCCEPRRLWRRYLIGNFQFAYMLLKDCLVHK